MSFIEKVKASPIYRYESIVIVLAVLLGSIGASIQHANKVSLEQRIRKQFETVEVLTVNKKLDANTVIKPEYLDVVHVLKNSITPNVLTSNLHSRVIDKVLKISLLPGDVIMFSALEGGTTKGTMSEKIPLGKRLFVLMLSDPLTKTGFIHPGDKVDILAQMNFPGKGNTTFTILEKVTLIAVGKEIDPRKGVEGTKISFFVTPKEMERLRFAQREGSFFISLRNPLDKSNKASGKGVNMDTFLLTDKVYESAEQKIKIRSKKKSKKK
jgi:Flp pilus assembly protein CpaB